MIKIDLKLEDFAKRFKGMQAELMQVLAASMQTNRAMMFDKDGADNDKPKWAPLRLRRGRPLQDKGYLRKSMAPHNDGKKPARGKDGIIRLGQTTATIGTKLAYAEMMNDGTTKMPGGVLKAVNAKALKIPLPAGKNASDFAKGARKTATKGDGNQRFMFRKSVKIPARPMDTITEADKQEFAETLAAYIAEALSG